MVSVSLEHWGLQHSLLLYEMVTQMGLHGEWSKVAYKPNDTFVMAKLINVDHYCGLLGAYYRRLNIYTIAWLKEITVSQKP